MTKTDVAFKGLKRAIQFRIKEVLTKLSKVSLCQGKVKGLISKMNKSFKAKLKSLKMDFDSKIKISSKDKSKSVEK